jgi:hypothetical protein
MQKQHGNILMHIAAWHGERRWEPMAQASWLAHTHLEVFWKKYIALGLCACVSAGVNISKVALPALVHELLPIALHQYIYLPYLGSTLASDHLIARPARP